MTPCKHESFNAKVVVNRIEDTKAFSADVTIHCRECGVPFSFLGFPAGLSFEQPRVNIDGTEARLPIVPGPQPMAKRMKFQVA